MKKIYDTVGNEIVEGNTILFFNENSKKWSSLLVIKEKDTLYASYDGLYLDTLYSLENISSSFLVRLFNKTKEDFCSTSDFKVKEKYPIDFNKIHSLLLDARNSYTKTNNCWDITKEDYLEFFLPYKGKYDENLLLDCIEDEVKF